VFWKVTENIIARVKTARTNQHLHGISHSYYFQHRRKYINDATAMFQRRGDIDKARELYSNRGRQLSAKYSGQASRCGRDQTVDLLSNYDNGRATTAMRKRVSRTVMKSPVINLLTLVSVFPFFGSRNFSPGAA